MQKATILKNKKLTIKVNFALDTDETNTVDYSKYDKVEIIRESGIIEEYEETEAGFARRTGTDETMGISLTEFALNEKRTFYRHLFQHKYKEIENLVILSGAGSSVGIGSGNKGRTMVGLWNELDRTKEDCLVTLIKETQYHSLDDKGKIESKGLTKDLEALLSKANLKNAVLPSVQLDNAIKQAQEFIVEQCTLTLPENSPHVHFLTKLLLRPQKFPRVKIFTLNYDTLFEQAAAIDKYTVIDGFTFSSPRVFNGKYFDYDIIETRHSRQDKKDNIIPKLFYLFKMHGSLNWRNCKGEIEQFAGSINVQDRVMIFPQESKYEHSYEQPYFEMMARFQQALRTENTLVITIGFSFLDKHISSVIIESLKQNSSLSLVACTFPEVVSDSVSAKNHQIELHRITELQSRICLVAETFEDFAKGLPENIAHDRYDLLEDLNDNLKKLRQND